MSSRYLIVTDGQTDRRTKAISIPRYALVHRAVKSSTVCCLAAYSTRFK